LLSARPSDATIPTTAVGARIVTLKYGPATGFVAPSTWWTLSAHPAYHTHRSIAALTPRAGSAAPASASSSSNCPRRPSISSATRYRIWPRLEAVLAPHSAWALGAAATASR